MNCVMKDFQAKLCSESGEMYCLVLLPLNIEVHDILSISLMRRPKEACLQSRNRWRSQVVTLRFSYSKLYAVFVAQYGMHH